jgi:hypothetical protein
VKSAGLIVGLYGGRLLGGDANGLELGEGKEPLAVGVLELHAVSAIATAASARMGRRFISSSFCRRRKP